MEAGNKPKPQTQSCPHHLIQRVVAPQLEEDTLKFELRKLCSSEFLNYLGSSDMVNFVPVKKPPNVYEGCVRLLIYLNF